MLARTQVGCPDVAAHVLRLLLLHFLLSVFHSLVIRVASACVPTRACCLDSHDCVTQSMTLLQFAPFGSQAKRLFSQGQSMAKAYNAYVGQGLIQRDAQQERLVAKFSELASELEHIQHTTRTASKPFSRWLSGVLPASSLSMWPSSQPAAPKGIYLHGDVGTGAFSMDCCMRDG